MKRHALDPRSRDYLEKHPELRPEARHNNRADEVADDARDHFFHPSMRKLSSLLIARHDNCVQFVHAIMLIISRVHIVSQELRRAQALVGTHPERPLPRFMVFNPILEIDSLQHAPVTFTCSQSMLSQHLSRQPAIVSSFAKLIMCGTSSSLAWVLVADPRALADTRPNFYSEAARLNGNTHMILHKSRTFNKEVNHNVLQPLNHLAEKLRKGSQF